MNPIHLTRFGFLNANYNARPTSVIRNSLSYARAHNINLLDNDVISKVFDDYFKWNFDYVHEIWEDLLAKPITGEKPLMSLRVKYRDIVRVIRKYESTDARGVAKEAIVQELKLPQLEIEQSICDCLRDGVIYEPVKGFYKLTRELA